MPNSMSLFRNRQGLGTGSLAMRHIKMALLVDGAL
jgi:hypothetical protein